MLSVHLHQVHFFSHHGMYEEEKILGNDFVIDLTVQYQPKHIPVVSIHQTINYVSLYGLVKKRMDQPTALLETVATEIAEQILNEFLLAEQVSISIKKLNPPIENIQGSVGIRFELKRKN
jgi:dihydroneopterin aldolase